MWPSIHIKRQKKTFQQLSTVIQYLIDDANIHILIFERCGDNIPKCKRCDDFCSIKDGKGDKREYKEKNDQSMEANDDENSSKMIHKELLFCLLYTSLW